MSEPQVVRSPLWISDERGHFLDWVTQRWVRLTGRRIPLQSHAWLDAPAGGTHTIGGDVFEAYATEHGFEMASESERRGLLDDFARMRGPAFDPTRVDAAVVDFYEDTANYELDAWAEWRGPFRPFGWLLAILFSRRLQQLNVPLSPLDTSRGVTSRILQIRDPESGHVVQTAWVRTLVATGHVLYAGGYSVVSLPGEAGPCVRVTFPLPNGNALVFLRPVAHDDGSMTVISTGGGFGDAGFYFTIRESGDSVVARYVKSLRESIRVYAVEDEVRADHGMTIRGLPFMRLHYRMRRRTTVAPT